MATQKIDLDPTYTILLFCCRFRFSFTFYCSNHWLVLVLLPPVAAVSQCHINSCTTYGFFSLFPFHVYRVLSLSAFCILCGSSVVFFSLFFYIIDTLCKDRMSCCFLIGISSLMVCTMSGTLFNGYEMVYCVLHRRGNQTTHLTISFTIFAHTSNMLKVSIHSTNNIPKKKNWELLSMNVLTKER